MNNLKDIIKEYNKSRIYSMALYQATEISNTDLIKAEIKDIGVSDSGVYIDFTSSKKLRENDTYFFHISRDMLLEIDTVPMNSNQAIRMFEAKGLETQIQKVQKKSSIKTHSTLEQLKHTLINENQEDDIFVVIKDETGNISKLLDWIEHYGFIQHDLFQNSQKFKLMEGFLVYNFPKKVLYDFMWIFADFMEYPMINEGGEIPKDESMVEIRERTLYEREYTNVLPTDLNILVIEGDEYKQFKIDVSTVDEIKPNGIWSDSDVQKALELTKDYKSYPSPKPFTKTDVNYLIQEKNYKKSVVFSGLLEYDDIIPLVELRESHKIALMPKKFVDEETKNLIKPFGVVYEIQILNMDFIAIISNSKESRDLGKFLDTLISTNYKESGKVTYALSDLKTIYLANRIIFFDNFFKEEDMTQYSKKFELTDEDAEIIKYLGNMEEGELRFKGIDFDLSVKEPTEVKLDAVTYYNYRVEVILSS